MLVFLLLIVSYPHSKPSYILVYSDIAFDDLTVKDGDELNPDRTDIAACDRTGEQALCYIEVEMEEDEEDEDVVGSIVEGSEEEVECDDNNGGEEENIEDEEDDETDGELYDSCALPNHFYNQSHPAWNEHYIGYLFY